MTNAPTRKVQPLILVRGFGGLGVEDEKKIAYQGFNDGTVYPQKRGENYIYEGLILRLMKSHWTYHDATNVVGYYDRKITLPETAIPSRLTELGFAPSLFSGHQIVIDPGMALKLLSREGDPLPTLWVFRYYDLNERSDFKKYGEALVRLIEFVQTFVKAKAEAQRAAKVNIIAHSMGGLIVREAVQRVYPPGKAAEHINKIVTLGTPHKGISFQILKDWVGIGAEKELERFNPAVQANKRNDFSYLNFGKHFPPSRLLTVVGTNYRTYGPAMASWLNRAFSVAGEFGPNYNRSDGLVKQDFAQLPGAPRTFVHKCHGGPDSLVTSREAFEVATRFLFGNIRVRLRLGEAKVTRGFDWVGKSEFFFGVSVKPRSVDFDLFHQSAEAENCYGPFNEPDFSDFDEPKDDEPKPAFRWANDEPRLIWEGWLDTSARAPGTDRPRPGPSNLDAKSGEPSGPDPSPDIVMRLDVYVGERDLYGLGFSDNVVFRKQYYARAVFGDIGDLSTLQRIELHKDESWAHPEPMEQITPDTWAFKVGGTGFEATMELSFAIVPEVGEAVEHA